MNPCGSYAKFSVTFNVESWRVTSVSVFFIDNITYDFTITIIESSDCLFSETNIKNYKMVMLLKWMNKD